MVHFYEPCIAKLLKKRTTPQICSTLYLELFDHTLYINNIINLSLTYIVLLLSIWFSKLHCVITIKYIMTYIVSSRLGFIIIIIILIITFISNLVSNAYKDTNSVDLNQTNKKYKDMCIYIRCRPKIITRLIHENVITNYELLLRV